VSYPDWVAGSRGLDFPDRLPVRCDGKPVLAAVRADRSLRLSSDVVLGPPLDTDRQAVCTLPADRVKRIFHRA
jgi:hypothetical protein